jgi:hypothetical protein
LPKHWWLLEGDNPGKQKRAEELERCVEEHGGELIFLGFDPSKRDPSKPGASSQDWYALVDTKAVGKPDELGKAMRARGAAKVLRSIDEPDDDN